MIRALEANGSKLPIFETDEERSFFRVVFEIHDDFKEAEAGRAYTSDGTSHTVKRRSRTQIRKDLIRALMSGDCSQNELSKILGYSAVTNTLTAVIKELLTEEVIAYKTEKQNDPKAKLTLLIREETA